MPPTCKIILNTKTLQLLSKFLEKNIDEVCFKIKNDIQISFQGLTGHHGALISIPQEKLKKIEGEDVVSVDTRQLSSIMQQFSGEFVEISVNEATLYLKDETQEGFLRLIEPDENKNFSGVSRTLPAEFTIDAVKLTSFLKAADNFGSYVAFNFDGKKKQLLISSQKSVMGFKRSLEVKESKGDAGKAAFQLDYIRDALEGASGNLKIEIGNEMPIKFIFNLGDADCQSFIAPRSEQDGGD